MTEYDFSPEAIDAYIQKQTKISNWVDNTKRHPPANPFTPATPAVRALHIKQEEDDRRHRRRDSKDARYRDREDRVKEIFVDVDASRHHHHRSTSPKSAKQRNRSASYSATATVQPDPVKGRNLPPPLPLGVYPNGYMSKQSSPTSGMYPYTWGRQARDSKHSSRTSSSSRLPTASNMHLHLQQNVPHSAPVVPKNVVRSQTTPAYSHQIHPAYQNGSMGYLPNAPQLPYSHYQPKPQPLLKRIFMNWGGTNKPKTPRRKRSSSF